MWSALIGVTPYSLASACALVLVIYDKGYQHLNEQQIIDLKLVLPQGKQWNQTSKGCIASHLVMTTFLTFRIVGFPSMFSAKCKKKYFQ